jgi:hypothetical protein
MRSDDVMDEVCSTTEPACLPSERNRGGKERVAWTDDDEHAKIFMAYSLEESTTI